MTPQPHHRNRDRGEFKSAHLLALSKAIDRLHAIQHSERRLRLAEQKAQVP